MGRANDVVSSRSIPRVVAIAPLTHAADRVVVNSLQMGHAAASLHYAKPTASAVPSSQKYTRGRAVHVYLSEAGVWAPGVVREEATRMSDGIVRYCVSFQGVDGRQRDGNFDMTRIRPRDA